MSDAITLRPIREDDLPFLARLYASTRSEELALVPWSDEEKQAFLVQQFDAQHRYYQEHFTEAAFDVVEQGGAPIGRLYVDRRENEIRIIDIALLPEFRGAGIGGRFMRELLDEAAQVHKKVTIHVERNNPALNLYHRLGFVETDDQGVYLFMTWTPPVTAERSNEG
jgi:ribosomal protein S18 acetylase RimI-like enzyme